MVKIEVELPEKWVKMITANLEWEGKVPVDLSGYVRDAVRSWLQCDLENMSGEPLEEGKEPVEA